MWEEPSEETSQNQRSSVRILSVYGEEDVNATFLRGLIPRHEESPTVVDCTYGCQEENKEEAIEVAENCGQEGGPNEKASKKEGNSQEEGRSE